MFWSRKPRFRELDVLTPRAKVLRDSREFSLVRYYFGFRAFIFRMSSVVLVLLVLFQVFFLQKKQDLKVLAFKNTQVERYVLPARGLIFDRKGRQLVFNRPSYDLYFDSRSLSDDRALLDLQKASDFLGLDFSELKETILESEEPLVLIKENLSDKERALFEGGDWTGFKIIKGLRREYIEGPALYPVLGFVGRPSQEDLDMFSGISLQEVVGKSGLERQYQSLLAGKKGVKVKIRDSQGRVLREVYQKKPVPGKNLQLYLDLDLQLAFYRALKEQVEKVGGKGGAGIILDTKTGGVLALVSYPSFDPNLLGKDPDYWESISQDKRYPLFNRAISARYPTGSVIKPLLGAVALKERIITPQTVIEDRGFIKIENPWDKTKPWIFRDWRAHGLVDLKRAIAVSCNVFFYTIGGGYGPIKGLGAETMAFYLSELGWNRKTGIDLPGENKGQIPSPEWKRKRFEGVSGIWLPGDTYNLSIGQGYLLVTPLEVAFSYFSLLEKVPERPRLAKGIVDLREKEPVLIEEFKNTFKSSDLFGEFEKKTVLEGMRDAVTEGSALMLSDLPFPVSAKTGTAEIGRPDVWQAWVVVLAPYPDPDIIMLVFIEEAPQGSVSTLPVAKEVLKTYFEKHGKKPTR